jgi:hypothetical protein
LVIALVGLAAVFGSVLQISQLGDAATPNILDARTVAMHNANNSLERKDTLLANCEKGPNGLRLSADDKLVTGNVV